MKNLVKKLLEKLLEKPLRKLARWAAEQNAAADAAREAEASGGTAATDAGGMGVPASPSSEAGVSFPLAGASSENPPPSSKPWGECRLSSNWADGASKRMMNMLSPKFDDKKFGDYLAWIVGRGCDHVHLFLINEGDGEGAGYDCCTDSKANAVALSRVKTIRAKGLGVVLWVIADDSPNCRPWLFANPTKYAKGAKNLLPYASAIVVGLEMDEGKPAPSVDQWKGVRSAFKSFAPNLPFGVHHTSGNEFKYASVGDFICGQLDPGCSTADIKKQIAAIRAKGKEAVGFEYERKPDRAKAQAALDAGAHAVGNW